MANLFYKPDGAWAADFISFYRSGIYHLFYLQDWRNAALYGEGTPWYQVSTRDFVNFTEHGQMLARGTQAEQELYVFTGSVVEGLGKYHSTCPGCTTRTNVLTCFGSASGGIWYSPSFLNAL